MLTRRHVLRGLIAAPAVILTPGLLMPVRSFSGSPIIPLTVDQAFELTADNTIRYRGVGTKYTVRELYDWLADACKDRPEICNDPIGGFSYSNGELILRSGIRPHVDAAQYIEPEKSIQERTVRSLAEFRSLRDAFRAAELKCATRDQVQMKSYISYHDEKYNYSHCCWVKL